MALLTTITLRDRSKFHVDQPLDVDTQLLSLDDASQLSVDVISNIPGESQSNGDVDLISVDDQAEDVEDGANIQQPSKRPNPKCQQRTQLGKRQTCRSGPVDDTHLPKKFRWV